MLPIEGIGRVPLPVALGALCLTTRELIKECHHSCYCSPSRRAIQIHCALPTRVLPKRMEAENAVLRALLGIIFACAVAKQPLGTPTHDEAPIQ